MLQLKHSLNTQELQMTDKQIKKSIIIQHDEKDCGVACVKSIFHYYNGDISLEKLRRESGTNPKGTSLLGLYQAVNKLGFNAEGLQGDIDELKNLNHPVILHLNIEDHFQHYVVCYKYEKGAFFIGDPAKGFCKYRPKELGKVWISGYVLDLTPNESFEAKGFKSNKSFSWLKDQINKDKPLFIAALFLGVIISVLSLSTAVFTQQLVDDILPKKDFNLLLKSLFSWGALILLLSVFNYLRSLLLAQQSFRFNIRVIKYFLSKLIYLPKAFFDSKKQGDMIARLNDSQKIQSAIQYVMGQAAIDAILVIISLSFLFYYNLETALFASAIIPLLLILLNTFLAPVKRVQHEVFQNHAINESYYIEIINGINTIKTHQKENYFQGQSQTFYSNYQERIFSFNKIALRFNLSNDIINSLVLILSISLGAFLYLQGEIEIGELLAILSIISILIDSTENLILANISIQGAKVALDRMFDFTEEKLEYTFKSTESTNFSFTQINIENLDFNFPGQIELLNNINLQVQKGEIVAILGENGCGKSTLIQIIQRFYEPIEGHLTLNQNLPLKDLNHQIWRKTIGVVPQQIQIFNGSVLDNICLDEGNKHEEKIIEFCKAWGFHEYFSKLQDSYYTLVGEEGQNISGGETQILALARALYAKPQFLILDEATSAMDRKTEQFVLKMLNNLKNEMAILFITHRLHIIKSLNSRIYIMEAGRIETWGSHDELLLSENLYSNYWKDLDYA